VAVFVFPGIVSRPGNQAGAVLPVKILIMAATLVDTAENVAYGCEQESTFRAGFLRDTRTKDYCNQEVNLAPPVITRLG
jgi:hypothetical protein